jgi:hypothetical protein
VCKKNEMSGHVACMGGRRGADWVSFIHSFISVNPYRITHSLDMENGNNNTRGVNNYNIQGFFGAV